MKKSLMENFIFCTVQRKFMNLFVAVMVDQIFCVNGVKIAEKIIFKNLFFPLFRYYLKRCSEKPAYSPPSGALARDSQTSSCFLRVFDVLKRASAFPLQYYRRPMCFSGSNPVTSR